MEALPTRSRSVRAHKIRKFFGGSFFFQLSVIFKLSCSGSQWRQLNRRAWGMCDNSATRIAYHVASGIRSSDRQAGPHALPHPMRESSCLMKGTLSTRMHRMQIYHAHPLVSLRCRCLGAATMARTHRSRKLEKATQKPGGRSRRSVRNS